MLHSYYSGWQQISVRGRYVQCSEGIYMVLWAGSASRPGDCEQLLPFTRGINGRQVDPTVDGVRIGNHRTDPLHLPSNGDIRTKGTSIVETCDEERNTDQPAGSHIEEARSPAKPDNRLWEQRDWVNPAGGRRWLQAHAHPNPGQPGGSIDLRCLPGVESLFRSRFFRISLEAQKSYLSCLCHPRPQAATLRPPWHHSSSHRRACRQTRHPGLYGVYPPMKP